MQQLPPVLYLIVLEYSPDEKQILKNSSPQIATAGVCRSGGWSRREARTAFRGSGGSPRTPHLALGGSLPPSQVARLLRSTQAAGRANPSRGQCCSGPWLHGALQAGWVPASTLGCQHPRGRTHPPPPEHGSFRTLAPAPSACRLCCAFCSPELPEASGPCPSSNPRGLQEACGVQSSLRDVWPW